VIRRGDRPRQPAQPPSPHPSGARPPDIPRELIPRHVALVMDGNGRWAKQRGLPRTAGHAAGEHALFDCVEGAIELGIGWLSAFAFSTENWKRSPDEVRFLMGFNEDVLVRRRDEMHALGVRVRWAGRRPRLWRRVIRRLEEAEELTASNTVLTLTMCVNYGSRAELADAAQAIAGDVAAGRLDANRVDERTLIRYLDEPDMPDVDLFLRTSGEQRISNFLLWQSAYAEFAFLDTLWPDFDRRHLWAACESYARRDRRYGGALPNPTPGAVPSPVPAARPAGRGVTRLHHVNVVVPPGATERVVPFYADVLGLTRVAKPRTGVAPAGAWFDLPDGTQVHVSERDGESHPDPHFGLVVEDLDAALTRLRAAGAQWAEQADLFGGRRGFTRDPAGNRVELLERAGTLA
jgi:undecaprenyl diphosphate synthase